MLQTLKDLFDSLLAPGAQAAALPPHSLQLATAVLLVEVMRADAELQDSERDAVLATLRSRFELSDDESARLLELAHSTQRQASDLHSFTSALNLPGIARKVLVSGRYSLAARVSSPVFERNAVPFTNTKSPTSSRR